MRRTLLALATLCLVIVTGLAFAASPFVAAWSLREAVRTADSGTIARKVDFDGVRLSLRQSLGVHAELYGFAVEAGRQVRPTLWQRVKSALGASMIDRFIETYISPDGLPKLYRAKIAWNEKVRGRPALDTLPWRERLSAYLERLKRAEFLSLTRVEIEMADEHQPDRHFVSLMELQGIEWRLVALRVVKPGGMATPRPAASVGRLLAGS
ncbi:MAG: DUF2939 domain-containing protein [Hyphomicrobiaceae bacterium]